MLRPPALGSHHPCFAESPALERKFSAEFTGLLRRGQPTKFELVINLKTAKGDRPRGAAIAARARR
jgi:hypothetical protein